MPNLAARLNYGSIMGCGLKELVIYSPGTSVCGHLNGQMSTIFKLVPLGLPFTVLLFCSCATVVPPHLGNVVINGDAGRGSLLMVKLQLEGGDELPFVVDTGAQVTLLDQSLESKLGKRLGTRVLDHFGDKFQSHVYAAPKLYLNGIRLLTARKVWTGDFKKLSSLWRQPPMGILGMDCLRHYCLQLDFADSKLCFLDSDRLDAAQLGERYPLCFSFPKCSPFIHQRGLVGQKEQNLLVDTGYSADGASTAHHFEPALASKGIQETGGGRGQNFEYMSVSKCVWNTGTYTNLLIGNGGNLIGLRFLARHLVTLDFPHRSMYLKQTTTGPLIGDRFEETKAAVRAAADSAQDFLQGLKKTGRLPRWTEDEEGTSHARLRFHYFEVYPITANFDVQKSHDAPVYHYVLSQDAKDAPWVLQKAWLADQNGHLIEEFPVR